MTHKKHNSARESPQRHSSDEPPSPQSSSPDIVLDDYAKIKKDGTGLDSEAVIDEAGNIKIFLTLKKPLPELPADYALPVEEYALDLRPEAPPVGPMYIVVYLPYLSLALRLILSHGHHVRIATHTTFKDFVLSATKFLKGKTGKHGESLEEHLSFFDVGGDPHELMAYMVKNPGLLPGIESLTNGDIGSKRKMTGLMLEKFYEATYKPDPLTQKPFAADAILSNPPAFAHIHVAEALGIPVHLTFTMPWSPTTSFSHPLVKVQQSNAEPGLTKYLSYAFAEQMTWQGLGDVINKWRRKQLNLDPLLGLSGPSILDRLKVPWTYCWSDAFIAKPDDWKEHIDVSGFYFMPSDTDYQPTAELKRFLAAGPPPMYIGFGSVVVDDPEAMTRTIFEAVESNKMRAIVSAGWGGLGNTNIPESVYIMKESVPHDWLFAEGRVSMVCHHGGAGTCAIGLKEGLPTIIVPFFGDQPFWGAMVHQAGAGPSPIKPKNFNVETLSLAIRYAQSQSAITAARAIASKISADDGEAKGVESFHKHLPLLAMRCDVDQSKIAIWWSDELFLRLSAGVAAVLVEQKITSWEKLRPYRSKEYDTRKAITDPVSGGATAVLEIVTDASEGVFQIFSTKPHIGIIKTATIAPRAIVTGVRLVHEGMENMPRLVGSKSRPQADVTDTSSGFREGLRGFAYGVGDGISSLLTEPFRGAKEEGAVGWVKGMGRSYVSVAMLPAAGALGLVALPMKGASKSLHTFMYGRQEKVLKPPRQAISIEQGYKLPPAEKKRILKLYKDALKSDEIKERQEVMKKVGK
ncbi:hypothetical protein B9479_005263 [Cryptococcus floricola]|uniref:Glycosyltransferase family 28 N-terminal domain-containing protein n=1 Tax=Cryptococcus floricola TaxID=2591691 RepID=A0A5D3ARF0_9TREE|nr:hypothetical protein B9479_005263 [Cryptococcus floricola]